MSWYRIVLIVLAPVVLMTSCHRHVYHVGRGAPSGEVVFEDGWHDHWLWGLVNTEDAIDVKKYCPSGHATITDEASFLNGLVTALIGLIYSPTSVTIQCREGRAHVLPLNQQQAALLAASPDFVREVGVVAPELVDGAVAAHKNALAFLNTTNSGRADLSSAGEL